MVVHSGGAYACHLPPQVSQCHADAGFHVTLLLLLLLVWVFYTGSYVTRPQVHYVAEAGLEPLILSLLLPPKSWDDRHEPQHPTFS